MRTPRSEDAVSSPGRPDHPQAATGLIDWSCALAEHESWLRSVLRCRVGDHHAVDDLLQEIALAVCRQASRPTDPSKVAPWLYRLAVRYAINFHRRNGRQRNLVGRVQQHAQAQFEEPGDILDWLIHGEQRALFHEALLRLRSQDREMLMLKYTENWTYQQLAEHLGASLNTVEYRLLRAKRRLRSLLTSMSIHEAVS